MPHKSLRLLSIICGVAYLATQHWQPYPGSFVLKGLSIATLALLAFLMGRRVSADLPILGIALVLSSIGDVLLDLDPERLFVAGLGSFLLAHLTYVVLFVRNRPQPFSIGIAQAQPMILVLVCTLTIHAWLLPSLGPLTLPVSIYMCAITAMVLTSILARFSNPWIVCGAILFLVSDSLLAVNKFKTPIPYRDYLVWATYYIAQFAIAIGFLDEKLGSGRNSEPGSSATSAILIAPCHPQPPNLSKPRRINGSWAWPKPCLRIGDTNTPARRPLHGKRAPANPN